MKIDIQYIKNTFIRTFEQLPSLKIFEKSTYNRVLTRFAPLFEKLKKKRVLYTACVALALIAVAFWSIISTRETRKTSRNEANIHFTMAAESYKEGDYGKALMLYEKALELNPEHAETHLNLAMIYDDIMSFQNKELAIKHYERYLELNPTVGKADMVNEWIQKARKELELNVNGTVVANTGAGMPSASPPASSYTIAEGITLEDYYFLERRIEELVESLASSEEQRDDYATKVKEMEKQLAVLKEDGAEHTEMKKLIQERERAKEELEKSNLKAETAAGQRDTLAEKVKELEAQLNALEKEETAQNEIKNLQKESNALKEELQRAHQKAEKIIEQRDAFAEQVKELGVHLTALEQDKTPSAEIKEPEKERDSLKEELQQAHQKAEKAAENLALYKETVNKEISLLRNEIERLTQETKRQPSSRDKKAEDRAAPKAEFAPFLRTASKSPGRRNHINHPSITYIVKDGDTLRKIAGQEHIYGDKEKWILIYEANKFSIPNADSLKPGQILTIPIIQEKQTW